MDFVNDTDFKYANGSSHNDSNATHQLNPGTNPNLTRISSNMPHRKPLPTRKLNGTFILTLALTSSNPNPKPNPKPNPHPHSHTHL